LGALPPNISTYGDRIDSLYHLILIITAVAFFLVEFVLLAFLVKYRAGASTRAKYTHGNTRLEIVWTLVPALILVFLGFTSAGAWRDIKMKLPAADMTVMVTGKQFNWEILYPGPDGKFHTPDDYQIDNELHVPVNKNIVVHLGSHDVIHSFFIPQARLKQDALPGREISAWFNVNTPGKYEIPCAELCGFGHSGMKGILTVESEEQWAAWFKEQTAGAGEAAPAEATPPPTGEAPPAGEAPATPPPTETPAPATGQPA